MRCVIAPRVRLDPAALPSHQKILPAAWAASCVYRIGKKMSQTDEFHPSGSVCRKSLAEFAPAGANKVLTIFSGGVYVGENTLRLANVRA